MPYVRCARSCRVLVFAILGSLVLALGAAFVDPATATSARSWLPVWGTDGRVSTIVTDPVTGMVYVGGSFSHVTDSSGRVLRAVHNFAVFNPKTGRFIKSWRLKVNGPVFDMALSGRRLYFAGDFTKVAGKPRIRLASISVPTGTLDNWSPTATGGKVLAISVMKGGKQVYVGGSFRRLSGHPVPYLGRVGAVTGAVDTGWIPRPNGRVETLAPWRKKGRIFAGGYFTTVLGKSQARSITSLNARATGAALTPGFTAAATNEGNKPPAMDLYLDHPTGLLLAGVGGQGGACAALNATTGRSVWTDHTNGNLQAVTATAGTAYCGGHFGGRNAFAGQTRYKLAAVNAVNGTVESFAPRVNSPLGVWALGHDHGGRLLVGGDFTKINRQPESHFAVFS